MDKSQLDPELKQRANDLFREILETEGELAKVQDMSAAEYKGYLMGKGFMEDEINMLTQDYALQAGVERFPWWLY